MTDVGSMGSNLSGGQRLRIGVARAIYANCKTILLDDPTSALDPHTTDQLFRYLAEVVVKQEKRLVVLTSHNIIALVRACDLAHQQLQGILVLHEGNELARGSYHSLISQCSLISELLHQQVDQQSFKNEVESTVSANLAEGLGEDNSKSLVKDAIETKLSGKIDRAVYWDYVCSLGIGNSFVTIFATVSMQVTSIMLSLFFGYWATHMDDFTTSQFLYISSSIVAANILCAIVRSFLFAFASLRSCQLLYNQLGQSVFNTYLAFFDRAPIGTVINRFGKDTNTIDDSLPFILNILLAQTVLLLGSVMVMIYTNPMILLLVAIVSYLYYHLQSFYRETSRELRRLESVYRSPIYTLFSESISGAVVLRALYSSAKWHAGHRSASMDMVTRNSWNVLEDPLVANNDTTESRAYSVDFYLQHHNILMHCMRNLSVALDRSLQVSFAVGVSSQWLGVRMQLLGMLITTCLALSIFLNNYYNVYPISAGIAGLSLIYSYNIVNNLNGFINALAETEQEMVSVERVLEFTKTLSSEYENIASPHNSQSQFTSSTQWFWNWTFTSLATNGYRSLSRDSTGASIRFDDILHSSTDDDVVVSLLHSNHETLLNIDSGESRKLEDDVEAAPLQVSPEFRSVYVLFSEKVGIKIKHLNLRYQNIESAVMKTQNTTSKIALDDISLDISPGSRVLIVGRTGSGKTSLLRTLLRLYEYDYSHIEFGMPQSQVFQLGIRGELNQISKKQLRRRVGVVPQTPVLFSESLRFNVDPYSEFTDEEIWQALQQSNFLQTLNVNEMNGSYTIHDSVSKVQTVVSCSDILNLRLNASDGNDAGNNSGCNLSHGQKQLLCLCRALLRQSDLLLIDELSAALDANTRACAYMAIRSYMDRIPSGILLMISHQMEGINSICNKVRDCLYLLCLLVLLLKFIPIIIDAEAAGREGCRIHMYLQRSNAVVHYIILVSIIAMYHTVFKLYLRDNFLFNGLFTNIIYLQISSH